MEGLLHKVEAPVASAVKDAPLSWDSPLAKLRSVLSGAVAPRPAPRSQPSPPGSHTARQRPTAGACLAAAAPDDAASAASSASQAHNNAAAAPLGALLGTSGGRRAASEWDCSVNDTTGPEGGSESDLEEDSFWDVDGAAQVPFPLGAAAFNTHEPDSEAREAQAYLAEVLERELNNALAASSEEDEDQLPMPLAAARKELPEGEAVFSLPSASAAVAPAATAAETEAEQAEQAEPAAACAAAALAQRGCQLAVAEHAEREAGAAAAALAAYAFAAAVERQAARQAAAEAGAAQAAAQAQAQALGSISEGEEEAEEVRALAAALAEAAVRAVLAHLETGEAKDSPAAEPSGAGKPCCCSSLSGAATPAKHSHSRRASLGARLVPCLCPQASTVE